MADPVSLKDFATTMEEKGYNINIPKPKLNRKKLYTDIVSSTRMNEKNNEHLATAFLADKLGVDPLKNDYKSMYKAWFGLKNEESVPDSSSMMQGIQNLINPKRSEAGKSFLEMVKDKEAGKGRQPLELEDTTLLTAKEFLTGDIEDAGYVDPMMKSFSEAPDLIIAHGRRTLSKDMQDFLFKNMQMQDADYFNYEIFEQFPEEEKHYAFMYLQALNPAQDKTFLNEVGTRLKQSGYDIGEGFASTARMFAEQGDGLLNPKMLYLQTKDIKDEKKLRTFIKDKLSKANVRGEIAPSFFYAEGHFAQGGNAEEQAEVDTEKIMKNYSQLMKDGERSIEREKAMNNYRSSVREHFTKKGLPREIFMSSVSMSLDLLAAMTLGIPTAGAGAAVYTYGRTAGQMRDTLVHGGMDPEEAFVATQIAMIPYIAAEIQGFKALTDFGKSFIKGFKPFSKDLIKTYGIEVGEEFVQTTIEATVKIYAKEFAEANGFEYSMIEGEFIESMTEAIKGMAFVSALGSSTRLGRHMANPNKMNVIEEMQRKADMVQEELDQVDMSKMDNALLSFKEKKMLQSVAFANSDAEIKELLDLADSDMTVKEVKNLVEAHQDVNQDVEDQVVDSRNRKNIEIQKLDSLADRKVTSEVLRESIGEYADIEEIMPGSFSIKSKVEAGIEYTVNIVPDSVFEAEYGMTKLGVSDSTTKTITLPESATDFKVVHENFHMMRDLGVITDSELKQLEKDARVVATPEFLDSIKELDKEGQAQELAANLIEEIKRTGEVPEGLDTVWQKIKRFIRDISSKFSKMVEKSGAAIAEDVIAGKPLGREAGQTQEGDQRFSTAPSGKDAYKDREGDQQGEPITPQEHLEGVEDESGTLFEDDIDEDKFDKAKSSIKPLRFSTASDVPFIKRSSLKGKKKFIYFSDRTKVGVYPGLDPKSGISIDLQGGVSYPYMDEHKGAEAGWAFTDENMFRRFQNRVNSTDGVGVIALYSKENLRANPTFANVYFREVEWAIKSKKVSKEDFLKVSNDLREATVNSKKFKPKSEWAALFLEEWTSVKQMEEALQESTFEVRGGMFFGYSAGKKGANKGSKIGSDVNVANGFPNISDMVDLFADPQFEGMDNGTLVGAVQFEKGQEFHSDAKDIGASPHFSYPVVIKGKGLGVFEDPIKLTEVLKVPEGKSERNVERSAEVRMADIRFSEDQQTNKERLQVISIAKKIIKGETIPKMINQDIIDKAQVVASVARTQISDFQSDPIINQQVRRAEIDKYYAGVVENIYQTAFGEGQAIAKAEEKIKQRIKTDDKVRQKREPALEDINELADDALEILSVKSAEAAEFMQAVESKVKAQVKAKIAASPESKELGEIQEQYDNDLQDYEIRSEIRENLIDVVKNEGGLLLDEDLAEALKQTGKLKGWARINLIQEGSGRSWDQMIDALNEAGITAKGDIVGQYDLVNYLDDNLQAIKKPTKPVLTATQKEIKAEYDLLYQGALKNTLSAIAKKILTQVAEGKKTQLLPAGNRKNQLKNRLSKYNADAKTISAVRKDGLELIKDIAIARVKKTAGEIRKEINEVLDPYTKPLKLREEQAKAKTAKMLHKNLKWGITNVLGKSEAKVNEIQQRLHEKLNPATVIDSDKSVEEFHRNEARLSVFSLLHPLRNKNLTPVQLEEIKKNIEAYIEKGSAAVIESNLKHLAAVKADIALLSPSLAERAKLRDVPDDEPTPMKTKMQTPAILIEDTFKLGLDAKGLSRLRKILNDGNRGLYKHIIMREEIVEKFSQAAEKILGKDHIDAAKKKVPGTEQWSEIGKVLTVGETMHKYSDIRQEHGQNLGAYQNKSGDSLNPHFQKLAEDMAKIEELLGPEVVKFMNRTSEILDESFNQVNDKHEEIFGHRMIRNEEFYFPMVQIGDAVGFEKNFNAVNFYQSFAHSRVMHGKKSKDIDYFAHFIEHVSDVAKFVHMTDPAIYNRDLLLSRELLMGVREAFGDKYQKDFIKGVTDMSINKAITKDKDNPMVDKFRSYSSITLLWGNVFSGTRQLMGMPGVALQLDNDVLLEMAQFAPDLLDSNSEVREFFRTIMKDPWMQGRMRRGFSEEMINAINVKGPKAWRNLIQRGMLVPGFGDILANSMNGALLYAVIKKSGKYDGFSKTEQHERIMADIMITVEATQQASMVATMPQYLRSGGSGTKALLQFASNPLLQASYYAQSYRDIQYLLKRDGYKFSAANPLTYGELMKGLSNNEQARKIFIKTLVLQHGVIPITQGLVSLAYAYFSKGELEEEDLWEVVIMMASGPISGVFMVNSVAREISNKVRGKHWSGGNIPLFKGATDAGIGYEIMRELWDGDIEGALGDVDRLGKQLAPPYKQIRRAVDNRK